MTLDREEAGLDQNPFTVAIGHGSLWVSTQLGTVVRIDPATLAVVASLTVGPVADVLAVSSDSIWAEACKDIRDTETTATGTQSGCADLPMPEE